MTGWATGDHCQPIIETLNPMKHLTALLLLAVPVQAQSAIYDAGDAGSPPVAPDPTTQGWSLVDPSGGMVGLSALSPDPGTGQNAWVIDDQVTFVGGRAHYERLFSQTEIMAAALVGWELSIEARLVTTAGIDVFAEFATGQTAADDRYLAFYSLSGNDVIANFFLSGISYVCPGGNDGSYHRYTIRKPAGASNVDAEFLFDGVSVGPVPRANSNGNAPAGGVNWGSGSSNATATVNFHNVEFATASGPIGTNYCTAVANSTGTAGAMRASGSTIASTNDVTLTAENLPSNQFGIFVTSRTIGFSPGAGGTSNGNVCLGGVIGRYIMGGQILATGSTGSFELPLDLNVTPQGNGVVSILAGETWHFQAWHRDGVGLGSNFTDGIQIDFQ